MKHVACRRDLKNAYEISVGNLKGRDWRSNIKIDVEYELHSSCDDQLLKKDSALWS
jgi:hypothetical protein